MSRDKESPFLYEVKCLGFREHRKNTLQGFAALRVDPPGLAFEVALHQKENKSWVGLPSKPWVDKAGATQYTKVLDLPDAADYWRFNALAVAAIKQSREEPAAASGNLEDVPF